MKSTILFRSIFVFAAMTATARANPTNWICQQTSTGGTYYGASLTLTVGGEMVTLVTGLSKQYPPAKGIITSDLTKWREQQVAPEDEFSLNTISGLLVNSENTGSSGVQNHVYYECKEKKT